MHRYLLIALVACALWACASDSETPAPSPDSGVVPTRPFGAACEDSSQCVSQLCLAVSATRAVCSVPCADRTACPGGESWACLQPTGATALLCACTSNAATEICGDGRDNDCDGVTDCSTDGTDSGMEPIPPLDGGKDDASMCTTPDCLPEPTCETDPGLCPLCEDGTDCDDGKPCTDDVCRGGGCVHVPRDSLCSSAQICDPRDSMGCVAAKACASDIDCTDDDACTKAEHCDTAAAICRMGFLDSDRDQHLPVVCGGDDCNDDDERVYPGALDVCDGRDNDCDGQLDPPSAALLCADGRMCQTGVCVCETGLQECNAGCIDPASFQDDEWNCGACGVGCSTGELCMAGVCEDVNECEVDDPCPDNSTCVNYEPGYECDCDDGYYPEAFDRCADINECAVDSDSCDDEPGACVNNVGGFECECPDGYTGDGVGDDGCSDIDECDEPAACPGNNTACFNDAGTFDCGCADGYLPDAGGVCGNFNECARELDDCDDSPGECTDAVGGYECSCPATHIEVEGGRELGCASRVTGLASGGGASFNCALLIGGRVQCWGQGSSGQLGVGSSGARGDSRSELVNADGLTNLGTGRTAKALAVGDAHACAILDNNTVKCWGANTSGQLGLGDVTTRGLSIADMGDSLPIVALGTGRTAKAIAAGSSHTCAILDNDTLKCWGENGNGQLGRDSTTDWGRAANQMGDMLVAINLGTSRTAKAVAAGYSHTCAILDDNTVKCWGGNVNGQLGLGATGNRGISAGQMAALPTVNLGTGLTAKAISLSGHSCAVLSNNSIKCWGGNGSGELGTEAALNVVGTMAGQMGDALPAALLGAGRTAKTVAAGVDATCAILDNDALKCWGYNGDGRLGLGNYTSYGKVVGSMALLAPVSLGTGRTPVAIRAGTQHVCALLDNQRIKCWGLNGSGVLGLGDTAQRGYEPEQMGDGLPYVRLGS